MPRWTGSPQYQKHLQKIRSMSAEKRAVTQGLLDDLSGFYADADMRKQLSAMRSAANAKAQDRNLDIRQGRIDMLDRQIDFDKDMNRSAEILGWAGLPISAWTGYTDMKHKKKLAGLYQGLANKV